MKMVIWPWEICRRRFRDACRRGTTRAIPLVDQGVQRPAERISRFILHTSTTCANTTSFAFCYHVVVFHVLAHNLLRWLRLIGRLWVIDVWGWSLKFNTFRSRMLVRFSNEGIRCKPGANIDFCDWLFLVLEPRADIFRNRYVGGTGSGRGQVLSRVRDRNPRHVTRWTGRFYNHGDVISVTKGYNSNYFRKQKPRKPFSISILLYFTPHVSLNCVLFYWRIKDLRGVTKTREYQLL